jgi:hypothetical protein
MIWILWLRIIQLLIAIAALYQVIEGKDPILLVGTYLYIDLRVGIMLIDLKTTPISSKLIKDLEQKKDTMKSYGPFANSYNMGIQEAINIILKKYK